MLFNSFEFLYFFPLIVLGFYIIPHKNRWLWLLLASYYFYMASEPTLVLFLLISTIVDYFCGLKMYATNKPQIKKIYLATSIAVNIGILVAFKYLFFLTSTFSSVLNFFGIPTVDGESIDSYNINQILLPVGISFYTFQTMSYSIEVYRGHFQPEKHFGRFALYVAFFPQLVAGPIERPSRLLPQLKRKVNLNIENIKKGLILIAWGFFLKIVVADRLGMYVDQAFSDPELHHGLPLILGAQFFTYQIYYDFSAYTSIALGAAKVMGYDLMNNFNRPFFSTSITQFWKRWHISLTQWINNYIYSPLRKGNVKRLIAVLIVFFTIGLWHGANWTFVIWGILNALLLIIEVGTSSIRLKIIRKLQLPKKAVLFIGWIIVNFCLSLTLVFFRAPSIAEAIVYFKNILNITGLHINILSNYFELFLSILLVIIVQAIHYHKGNNRIHELMTKNSKTVQWSIAIVYIFIIVLFAVNRQNTFIYFQF